MGATMIWLLSAAVAIECQVYTHGEIPDAIPGDDGTLYAQLELDDVVVMRPLGTTFASGLTYGPMQAAVRKVMQDRTGEYDFITFVHTDQLPTQFPGAAAFHLSYNNADLYGTGNSHRVNADVPIRAILWMNHLDYWDERGDEQTKSVFAQEVGHYWLAFAQFQQGLALSNELLGRGDSHWSTFMDTPNSPMEGNPWLDNGDGTFTSDINASVAFAPIDLYLMGLVEKEDVPPFFFIKDPIAPEMHDSMQLLEWIEEDVTISGTRVDVAVDDVIDAIGARAIPIGPDFRMLTIMVLGVNEQLTTDHLDRVRERQIQWTEGWNQITLGHSTMDFTVDDEGWGLPKPPTSVAGVPRSAW
jgi:large repetitive protein